MFRDTLFVEFKHRYFVLKDFHFMFRFVPRSLVFAKRIAYLRLSGETNLYCSNWWIEYVYTKPYAMQS